MANILYHYPLRGSTELIKGVSNNTHVVSGAVVDGNSKIGKSYKFDGNGDYIYLDDIDTVIGKAFFLRVYIDPNETDTTNLKGCFYIGADTADIEQTIHIDYYNGGLNGTFNIVGSFTWASFRKENIEKGKWYDCCLYVGANKQKFWVNEELVGEAEHPAIDNATDRQMMLGKLSKTSTSVRYFKGNLNDLIIFDGEPTKKQLQELYLAKYVHIQFENSLQDCSGYGNHLTGDLYKINTTDNKVGKNCIEGTGGSSLGATQGLFFPEYMTSLYPYVSICFYYKYGSTPINFQKMFEAGSNLRTVDKLFRIYYSSSVWNANYRTTTAESDWVTFSHTTTDTDHFCIQYNGISNTISVYKNGELIADNEPTNSEVSSTIRRYFKLMGSLWDSNPQGLGIMDDFRMYGTILPQDEIKRIISERFFIDKEGNLYCYKKNVVQGGKGFHRNGYVEYDGFHQGDVDGTDNKIMRQKQGNILGVNKIIEGY